MLLVYTMPSDSPFSEAPDCYTSSMGTSLGHALYYPEPHNTGAVQIGDVGYISGGAFVRLLNLDVSAIEHAVTSWTPPFEITDPLPSTVFRDRATSRLPPGSYEGTRRDSNGVQNQGALELPAGADGQMILENSVLKEYITRNHGHWYAYARDTLGLRVEQKQLIVVSGWFKTSGNAWSIRTQSSLHATTGGAWAIRSRPSSSTSITGLTVQREGLGEDHAEGVDCVFLSYYQVEMLRGRVYKVVAVGGLKSELEYSPQLQLLATGKNDPLAEISKFISSR
ncbi:hypothetical protein PsYK624_134850 [Phanerochaete sordida]|uniref:Uncharacterized protein n=1 Tax=Phanerochaete sordida TaxID=48140 RepID=A0A9P3LK20_9APHY|nr:hypothetical protein PsYK624_134850 [Phanerochaete sordida]